MARREQCRLQAPNLRGAAAKRLALVGLQRVHLPSLFSFFLLIDEKVCEPFCPEVALRSPRGRRTSLQPAQVRLSYLFQISMIDEKKVCCSFACVVRPPPTSTGRAGSSLQLLCLKKGYACSTYLHRLSPPSTDLHRHPPASTGLHRPPAPCRVFFVTC